MNPKPEKVDLWMPFYVGDYLADTMHLSAAEHGGYLMLILHYWKSGPIADDDTRLAIISRMGDAWGNASSTIRAFFKHRDGMLVHDRIDREKVEASSNKSKKVAKAKAAADARWNKEAPSNAQSMPQAKPEGCPSPSPSPSPNGEIKNNVAAAHPDIALERRQKDLDAIEEKLVQDPVEKPRKHYGSDEDMTAARWMFDMVRKVNATAREPNWNAWANDVRLMREIDGRTHHEICELFKWVTKDNFWCGNVQSPGKLREKWDQLTVQRARPQAANGKPTSTKFHFGDIDYSSSIAAAADSQRRMGVDMSAIADDDPINF